MLPLSTDSARQRAALIAWLLLMLFASLYLGWQISRGLSFDTSIMSLLPDGEGNAAEEFANNKIAAAAGQRLLLVISGARQQSLQQAQDIQQQLSDSGLFAQVQGKASAGQLQSVLSDLKQWRYFHLTDTDRALLTGAENDGQNPLIQQAIARLYSPLGSTLAQQLKEDPLQLFDHWRSEALQSQGISLQDDWPTVINRTSDSATYHRIIVSELNGSAFAMGYQQQVMAQLNQLQTSYPQLKYSGLLVHAAYGAQQAKQEISTIGVVSVVGIVLLLLLVFRRPTYLLLVFTPLLSGCLLALSVSLLLFDRVHMITLAFGASLVGVAIDYPLHFLCHQLEQNPAAQQKHSNRSVFVAISLGMISSVLAYLAQAAAPFPGLQQMAVFSALGLAGAWLTVVGVMPYLTPRPAHNRLLQTLLNGLAAVQQRWPVVQQKPTALLLATLTLACLAALPTLHFDDSIVHLQTSPPALLKKDYELSQLTNSPSWSRYLLVSDDSPQRLLQTNEAVTAALHQRLPGLQLQSVTQQLSSEQRQLQNYQLQAQQVYNTDGLASRFFVQLGAAQLTAASQAEFIKARGNTVTPQTWLNSPLSEASRVRWLGEFEGRNYSIITFSGQLPADLNHQLRALTEDEAFTGKLDLVDRPAAISNLLGHYRHSLGWWIALAYGAVLMLLALRYRLQAWRIIAGPALASLLTLNLLALLGIPLTLFHLLALLLVLGIGMDAGIFLLNSRNSLHTWLAVALSALTTLLAFGLLALSSTPVLTAFGATVLSGVIFVWLLTPAFTLQRGDSL